MIHIFIQKDMNFNRFVSLLQPQSPPAAPAQTTDPQSTEDPVLAQGKGSDLAPEEQKQNTEPEVPERENVVANPSLKEPDPEPELDKKEQVKPGYKMSFVKSTWPL